MKRKSFFDTEAWKWIRTALEIAVIAALIWFAASLYTSLGFSEAKADEYEELVTGYVQTKYLELEGE